ncbi:hypothetical protein [Nocardia sp. CA-119907]
MAITYLESMSCVSVTFLTMYFETKKLTPFAGYCLVAGIGSAAFSTVRG